MQTKLEQFVQKSFLILTIFSLIVSCSNRKNQNNSVNNAVAEKTEITDKNSLFDGETLDGWNITEYGTEGHVTVSDGKIILNYGDGITGINWLGDFPKVNYEITLEARKTVGNDFFCGITFPVNDQFCSLIVGGWGGPVVGLSCIDGDDAAHNETQVLKKFDKEVWYNVRLKVDSERITAWIDDEKLIDFAYAGYKLSLRAEVGLSKPFGLFTWETTGEIRNLRMKIND